MEEKECWLIHPASAHLVEGHFSTVPHYISTTVLFVKNGMILICVYICFQMLLLVTRDFRALGSRLTSWTRTAFWTELQKSFCFMHFPHTALFYLPLTLVTARQSTEQRADTLDSVLLYAYACTSLLICNATQCSPQHPRQVPQCNQFPLKMEVTCSFFGQQQGTGQCLTVQESANLLGLVTSNWL